MGYQDRDYYKPSGFGGFSYFPQVIKQILFINVIVFLIQIIAENLTIGGQPGFAFINKIFALNGLDPRANFQIWQLLTYQFMHADFSHIFWNMFMFWMFGVEIANMFGNKKFWMFYLLSGIGAGLFQIFLGDALSFTVGASGAVSGIMIAFAMFFPDRPVYLYFLIPVKAKYLIGFLFILDFFMIGGGGVVAHLAHVGGAVTGALFIIADKQSNFSQKFFNWFQSYKRPSSGSSNSGFNFRKPFKSSDENVKEAQFYDINESSKEEISQEEIDRILDKISRSGYQNLTAREKKILFEASKKD